jgi:hypothetical protein
MDPTIRQEPSTGQRPGSQTPRDGAPLFPAAEAKWTLLTQQLVERWISLDGVTPSTTSSALTNEGRD